MLDTLDELNIPTDSSVPDHSLLLWEYTTDNTLENRHQTLLLDNRTDQHNKKPKSFRGQQGKPIFKSKGTDEKAIDQLIEELDDLTLSDTMHALDTQLQRNYNAFYSLIENAIKNKKTHHRSYKKLWWNNDLDSLRKELRTLQSKWSRSTEPTDRLNHLKDHKNKQQRRFNQSSRNAKRKY